MFHALQANENLARDRSRIACHSFYLVLLPGMRMRYLIHAVRAFYFLKTFRRFVAQREMSSLA